MSEPDATTVPPADAADAAPSKQHKAPRWRRALVALLVIVGCVLAPFAITGVYLKNTILDTGHYVDTVGPLADNPDVQEAVANRITQALTSNVPIEQEIADVLPQRAKFLAPKIENALAAFVHDQALNLVESDKFSELWKQANERAHDRIVALLEGKSQHQNVSTKNGEITLDLGAIIEEINARLEDRGITAFSTAAANNADRQIVLVQSDWLKKAQTWTDLLQKVGFVLPVLVLLCFAGAIALSPNRRRTILRGALGIALGTGLFLVAINSGRHFYLDALPSSVNLRAATAVYDQLIGDLRLALRTGFVFGLVVAIAAWLSGPARSATRAREGVLGLVRGKGAEGGPASPTAEFVARHRNGLRATVIGIGLAVLVVLNAPTPAAVIVIAVLVLLGMLLIEFLARRAPATTESESESDVEPDTEAESTSA